MIFTKRRPLVMTIAVLAVLLATLSAPMRTKSATACAEGSASRDTTSNWTAHIDFVFWTNAHLVDTPR